MSFLWWKTKGELNIELMIAAMEGHAEPVKSCLRKGANVNAKDTKGKTALLWAADSVHAATAEALLDNGADIDARDNLGRTALMKAALSRRGLRDTVRLLLGNGADINARSNDGKTALTLAKEKGDFVVIELLEQAEAIE